MVAISVPYAVRVLSRRDGTLVDEVSVTPKGVYGIAWSNNGRYLAVGAADKTACIWELEGIGR